MALCPVGIPMLSSLVIKYDSAPARNILSKMEVCSGLVQTLRTMSASGFHPQATIAYTILGYNDDRREVASVIAAYNTTPCGIPPPLLLMTLQELDHVPATEINFPVTVTMPTTISIERSLFPDIKLVVEGKSIPCHKALLASHSEYFRTLFSSTQVKDQSGSEAEFFLEDIEYELLEKVIASCYRPSSSIADFTELCEILRTADKFQMTSLLQQCLGFLPPALEALWEAKKWEFVDNENLLAWMLAHWDFKDVVKRNAMVAWLVRNWWMFEGEARSLLVPYLEYFQTCC